jgi:hypothetical protein
MSIEISLLIIAGMFIFLLAIWGFIKNAELNSSIAHIVGKPEEIKANNKVKESRY